MELSRLRGAATRTINILYRERRFSTAGRYLQTVSHIGVSVAAGLFYPYGHTQPRLGECARPEHMKNVTLGEHTQNW